MAPIHAAFRRIDTGAAEVARSVITEQPNELFDVIWLSPGTWPNCRSKGEVTDEAITSGLAPG